MNDLQVRKIKEQNIRTQPDFSSAELLKSFRDQHGYIRRNIHGA